MLLVLSRKSTQLSLLWVMRIHSFIKNEQKAINTEIQMTKTASISDYHIIYSCRKKKQNNKDNIVFVSTPVQYEKKELLLVKIV